MGLVVPCHHMQLDLLALGLDVAEHHAKLHEQTELVGQTDVRIDERDPAAAFQVFSKELLVGDAGLVVADHDLPGDGLAPVGYAKQDGDLTRTVFGFFHDLGPGRGIAVNLVFQGLDMVQPPGLQVFVDEVYDLVGLVHADELVLDAFAAFDGKLEDLPGFFLAITPVGIYDLDEAAEGLHDAVAVAGGQGGGELEMVAEIAGMVFLTQLFHHLGEVIDDEAVPGGEHLAAQLAHLPAGQVGMHAVEEGGMMIGLGQGLEQIAVLEHIGYAMLGIAHEGHGGRGAEDVLAAGEALVGHVVLHDVLELGIAFFVGPGKLVEGHHIPVAYQSHAPGGIVDEKVGNAHLAPGHEDAVGR